MKQDAIMASLAKEIEQPNNEGNKVSNEEFDQFKSISMDSEGKEKMAELEDKARLPEAQFGVENRITVQRIKNIREELKVTGQEKEATISQECEEIKTRTDDLCEDMSRLEKKIMEGEMLEREERKKIGKEKRKVEKPAALATIGREEIEDETKDGVSLKVPLSSDQPFVHSHDESIQTKQLSFCGDGAASKVEKSVNDISGKYCSSVNGCLSQFTAEFDDRLTLQNGLKQKGSVKTVVSISEQLLQQEMLNAFKAAAAVQSTKVFNAVSYVKQTSVEIEMNDEVSFEQEDHKKELNRIKEEPSEVSHQEEALCKTRESLCAFLKKGAEERNNFLTEIVELTNRENEKLQNQIDTMREETKAFEIENQSLHTELETVKLELKRLKFSELAAKKEIASGMVIYSEEIRKRNVCLRWKEKRRKHEIRKLRKDKGDIEEELVSTKRLLTRKEHELNQTKKALTLMTETAETLKQRVLEMENCLDYFFDNSCTMNSDISSIPDDCVLNDSASYLDICSVEEVGTRKEKEEAGHEELSFDKDAQADSKDLSTEELNSVSKELTSQTDEEMSASLLTITAVGSSKAVETQLVHVYQILKGSLQELDELKTMLGRRQESWKTKKYERMVDEVAWLGDELYAKDNQLEALRYESIKIIANRDATIQRLEGELENARISLKQITEMLEHTEAKLQIQTSLLTSAEANNEAIVKQLEGDLESTQILLKEKVDALEHIEGKLQLQTSLLASEEAKKQDNMKQLHEGLDNTHVSLEEKKYALEQTEGELQLQKTVFASTEGTYEDIIRQLQEELQNMYTSLMERTNTLEKTEERLQLLTSFFESTESKYEDIIKQLQEELESTHFALQQTQARLEICLNEKSQDAHAQTIRFGVMELTQDELELVFAELKRAKNEKAKLLQEVADATVLLKLEKRTARRDKDVLWELFNTALKELEEKTQLIWDLKMNLTETRIQAFWLDSEKRELQEYDNNHKQTIKASNSMIGSIKQEKYGLRSQNQRFNIELLQTLNGMTQDEEEDSPSGQLTVRGVTYHLNVTLNVILNLAEKLYCVLSGRFNFSTLFSRCLITNSICNPSVLTKASLAIAKVVKKSKGEIHGVLRSRIRFS